MRASFLAVVTLLVACHATVSNRGDASATPDMPVMPVMPVMPDMPVMPVDGSDATTRDFAAYPAVYTSSATKIDAIGDLHGDYNVTRKMLTVAGLIDPATLGLHWSGGTRTVIVTGDVIDKGNAATAIIDLFITLETEAAAAGGAFVVTLGNHEAEFLADPTADKSSMFQAELVARGLSPTDVAAGASPYGAWLRHRPVAASVGDWFFCHGGNTAAQSIDDLTAKYTAVFAHADGFTGSFLVADDSLLEADEWWEGKHPTDTIDASLMALGASHLVFGHEPGKVSFAEGNRARGQMVTRFDARIFLIDVGMSSAVGYSDGALLRIDRTAGTAQALAADGTLTTLWP